MADRGEKSSSRKAARALPLTHRQQKSTKRPQSDTTASRARSTRRSTSSSGPRRKQVGVALTPMPDPMIEQTPPVTKTRRLKLSAPSDEVATTVLKLKPSAPAETVATRAPKLKSSARAEEVATTVLKPRPVTPPAEEVATTVLTPPSPRAPIEEMDTTQLTPPPPPPAAPIAVAEPARQKVRVRRKRPVAPPPPMDFTRQDTIPLPMMVLTPSSAPVLVEPPTLAAEPSQPMVAAATATEEPTTILAPTQHLEATTHLDVTTILAPTTHLDVTTTLRSRRAVPSPAELEPTSILKRRRHVESPAEVEAIEAMEAAEQSATALEPTTLGTPVTPESASAELEPTPTLSASDAPTIAVDVEDESATELDAEPPALPRQPRTLAVMAALAPRGDVEAPPPAAEPDDAEYDEEGHVVLQPPISVEAPASSGAKGQSTSEAAQSGRHRGIQGMWWPLAAFRRAAPETRPVAPPDAMPAADGDNTAPRRAVKRDSIPAAPEAVVSIPARPMPPARLDPPPGFDLGDLPVEPLGAYTSSIRVRRQAAHRPHLSLTLTWMAGAHAAVASVAALIAAIAVVQGATVAAAWTVFSWSIALTLIAGVGAAVAYLCIGWRRLRGATLALLMSQVAAYMWALALVGPRAALLALVPASAALALRGIGQASAVATAFAWISVFIVDEVYTLIGGIHPALALNAAASALVDIALPLIGLWLIVSVLIDLHASRMRAQAHSRALEHSVLLSDAELSRLRTQMEDDAEALRRALHDATHGDQPERVFAHGAFSAVGDAVNDIADRLIDLRYDRAERKRLEAATRRLTRVIERAWLGLSWSWPDATGTILDDLLALLRTPPPLDTPALLDETTPTGQVVAPHLFRNWQPSERSRSGEQPAAQPAPPPAPMEPPHGAVRGGPSQPSQPSLPSLWPSDPGAGLISSLDLPPYPRWRSPDSQPASWPDATEG